MKHTARYILIASLGIVSLSACTMGDKGSSKVPDSVKIDTTKKASTSTVAPAKPSDTTLIDSLQTDTAKKAKK